MIDLIKPYNPDWKIAFEILKHRLASELKDFEIDIQHVGSTSIPGLPAKSILDIDIILYDKTQLGDITGRLEKIGYISKGEQGIPGRLAFRQGAELTASMGSSGHRQEHHIYVCFSDSLALKYHVMFRDILLKDKNLAGEYAQLKINLAKEKGMTRELYTKQKAAFILKVLALNGLDEKELSEIKKTNL